jgi:SAM-dependent methyltransferase
LKFKDHFSGHAGAYAQFRPRYPDPLFQYLAALAPARERAWDCATGNGQAAVSLARYFTEVIATDASAQQIAAAEPHDGVVYCCASAEQSGLDSSSIDVLTVAQALHWFDLPAFFAEARRVLKPRGIIAVWSYNLLSISPEIDALVNEYYRDTLRSFWPAERALVEAGYGAIDVPFDEVEVPLFTMEAEWTLDQLIGYLRTWSATQKFIAQRGFDPVDSLADKLRPVWRGGNEQQAVRWPLSIRIGRRQS